MEAYLRQEERITEQLDAIFDSGDEGLDPVLEELQHRTLRKDPS